MTRSSSALLLALATVATLASCTAAPPPAETTTGPTEVTTASVEPLADPPADVIATVRAIATDSSGAQLNLVLWVRVPVNFDDLGASTVPAAITQACPEYTSTRFAQEQWTFTRINVSATGSDGWSSDSLVTVLPADGTIAAPMSFFSIDAATAGACAAPTTIASVGRGALSVGNPADHFSDGQFHGWLGKPYGFRAGEGTTLSGCEVQPTESGSDYAGGSAAWSTVSDDAECSIVANA